MRVISYLGHIMMPTPASGAACRNATLNMSTQICTRLWHGQFNQLGQQLTQC